MKEGTILEVLEHLKDAYNISTNYGLAKALNVQPIQITHWKNGKGISEKSAKKIFNAYGIIITNINMNLGRPRVW